MAGKIWMFAAAAGIAGLGASVWALAQSATIGALDGPSAAVGVSVVDQHTIDLAEAFPSLDAARGRTMRARNIVVDAGGIVRAHSHEGRPAITYVTAGRIVEHRSDSDGPIEHSAGDVTFDNGGVAQWWENVSDAPATLYVVDITPPGAASDDL